MLPILALRAGLNALVVMATLVAAPHPARGHVASARATRVGAIGAIADTAVGATDPNAQCVMRRGAWSAIPFARVSLGPQVAKVSYEGVLWGPHTRMVVTDSTQWPAVWRAATDPSFSPDTLRLPDGRDSVVAASVPTPPIRFGHDAIVFTASSTWTIPTELEITSVRRCRLTGAVVVHTLETKRKGGDLVNRAFAVVRVRRRTVEGEPVVFVDRKPSVYRLRK